MMTTKPPTRGGHATILAKGTSTHNSGSSTNVGIIDEHLGWVAYAIGSVLDGDYPVDALEGALEHVTLARTLIEAA